MTVKELLERLAKQDPDAIVVVGPPFERAVSAEATRLGAAFVRNADPTRGMASSVALGFAAALARWRRGPDGALLWPVDHPHVHVDSVRAPGIPGRSSLSRRFRSTKLESSRPAGRIRARWCISMKGIWPCSPGRASGSSTGSSAKSTGP